MFDVYPDRGCLTEGKSTDSAAVTKVECNWRVRKGEVELAPRAVFENDFTRRAAANPGKYFTGSCSANDEFLGSRVGGHPSQSFPFILRQHGPQSFQPRM